MTKVGSVIGHNDRLQWGRGSERPAAHTQQKLTQVPPPEFILLCDGAKFMMKEVFLLPSTFLNEYLLRDILFSEELAPNLWCTLLVQPKIMLETFVWHGTKSIGSWIFP